MVGIPNEGNTQCYAYDNRLMFMQRLGALQVLSKMGIHDFDDMHYEYPEGTSFEFSLGTVGNILTPIARDRLAEMAVEYGYDYVLFIDDDMIANFDLFEKLYSHQKDIVAALAFTRFAPHKPVIYLLEEGFDSVMKKNYYTSKAWLAYPKDTLVECDAVGFGSVLINADLFRNMPRPWFTAATGKGEDIQFCFDARKAGYKVYMDTSCKLGHLGPPKTITEEIYESETNVNELRDRVEETSRRFNGKEA